MSMIPRKMESDDFFSHYACYAWCCCSKGADIMWEKERLQVPQGQDLGKTRIGGLEAEHFRQPTKAARSMYINEGDWLFQHILHPSSVNVHAHMSRVHSHELKCAMPILIQLRDLSKAKYECDGNQKKGSQITRSKGNRSASKRTARRKCPEPARSTKRS